ncbi:5'-adenylylsulfate reductase-like 4 [Hibiscus syriacus]|uniref:5'-adenylylsulfate reductase-like 4 n=1 Tax=Hibiscus syriacus TaxID=106335 RepID=A0A6A3BBI2_HIBSY|nr:5'-adenylylsulfate reductase-like 4 [Hibiscus syriacus]KAE8714360.1 5'-adenylylsulfate reductase-like 4 [Hibiscus syriacus]
MKFPESATRYPSLMGKKVWEMRILTLFLWCRLTCPASVPVRVPMCPKNSVLEAVFDFGGPFCSINSEFNESIDFVGVTEGDEISLQRALDMVQRNSHEFVAVLFYASWCPFSRSFRPSFTIISSSYPSIPHFAIKESAVRPSILSKYGVYGFPTLFLLNSRMRVHYHGNRSVESVSAFYNDVTGFKNKSPDRTLLDTIRHEKHNITEQESCSFSWARSPQNLLQQETYLALATAFVLLRLLYLLYPTLLVFAHFTWRRLNRKVKLGTMLEHPMAYLKRKFQFISLKEPCKRSNLQGAMNARAWASKSLATVAIGDANSSWPSPMNGSI